MQPVAPTAHDRKPTHLRFCDNCGAAPSAVVDLEEYGGETLCRVHAAERRAMDASDEQLARHIGQLLEHRYKYQPTQLIKDVADLMDLSDDLILALMQGRTWAEIYAEEAREGTAA